jgi:hypothetical protein
MLLRISAKDRDEPEGSLTESGTQEPSDKHQGKGGAFPRQRVPGALPVNPAFPTVARDINFLAEIIKRHARQRPSYPA